MATYVPAPTKRTSNQLTEAELKKLGGFIKLLQEIDDKNQQRKAKEDER